MVAGNIFLGDFMVSAPVLDCPLISSPQLGVHSTYTWAMFQSCAFREGSRSVEFAGLEFGIRSNETESGLACSQEDRCVWVLR